MHYCRIDPNADLPEIERELRYWRTRQLLTVIPSTAREVGDDIARERMTVTPAVRTTTACVSPVNQADRSSPSHHDLIGAHPSVGLKDARHLATTEGCARRTDTVQMRTVTRPSRFNVEPQPVTTTRRSRVRPSATTQHMPGSSAGVARPASRAARTAA